MWKKSYEENKLHEIIFPDLRQNMDPTSLKTFLEIAFQCLEEFPEERPEMSLVVKKLGTALKCQEELELQKPLGKYEEIVTAAVHPLIYKSMKEVKMLLLKGFLINGGKMVISYII